MKRLVTLPAWIYLGVVVVIGAILRLWDSTKSSIWHDEGYTMMLAPMNPLEIITRTARDVHPPLYYLVLHYWMALFGTSELAARSLSTVFTLVAIPIAYLLIRKLWTESAARLAALFVATGPFLIRYSQEARMYGMLACIVLVATYALVKAVETNRWVWWAGYALLIAAGLYTHYYTIFVIIAHWIYMLAQTSRTKHAGLWNFRWWAANVLALLLFLPWVPSAVAQFTRVQASFWIPRPNAGTLPETLFQFLTYGSGGNISVPWRIAAGLVFIGAIVAAWVAVPKRRLALVLLSAFCLTGPVLVFLLSFQRPIYVDRYFVFAGVAFYCLLAVLVSLLPRKTMVVATLAILALFGIGIYNIHKGANHQMAAIGAYVNAHYQPGDEILSGELYTFFDFSYYNHTGEQTRLWSKNGVNGYGESSLIYDRPNEVIVHNLADLHPESGRVWVVGKIGQKDYYTKIPANWVPIGPKITAGQSAVQEYQVGPRGSSPVAVQ